MPLCASAWHSPTDRRPSRFHRRGTGTSRPVQSDPRRPLQRSVTRARRTAGGAVGQASRSSPGRGSWLPKSPAPNAARASGGSVRCRPNSVDGRAACRVSWSCPHGGPRELEREVLFRDRAPSLDVGSLSLSVLRARQHGHVEGGADQPERSSTPADGHAGSGRARRRGGDGARGRSRFGRCVGGGRGWRGWRSGGRAGVGGGGHRRRAEGEPHPAPRAGQDRPGRHLRRVEQERDNSGSDTSARTWRSDPAATGSGTAIIARPRRRRPRAAGTATSVRAVAWFGPTGFAGGGVRPPAARPPAGRGRRRVGQDRRRPPAAGQRVVGRQFPPGWRARTSAFRSDDGRDEVRGQLHAARTSRPAPPRAGSRAGRRAAGRSPARRPRAVRRRQRQRPADGVEDRLRSRRGAAPRRRLQVVGGSAWPGGRSRRAGRPAGASAAGGSPGAANRLPPGVHLPGDRQPAAVEPAHPLHLPPPLDRRVVGDRPADERRRTPPSAHAAPVVPA